MLMRILTKLNAVSYSKRNEGAFRAPPPAAASRARSVQRRSVVLSNPGAGMGQLVSTQARMRTSKVSPPRHVQQAHHAAVRAMSKPIVGKVRTPLLWVQAIYLGHGKPARCCTIGAVAALSWSPPSSI